MTVQIRTEVSQGLNAQVHYVAKSLGVKVSEVYRLMIAAYLADYGLEGAVKDLSGYRTDKADPAEPVGSETGKARD